MSELKSNIDVCNFALSLVGADEITTFTDNTKESDICNRMYDQTRRSLLRNHWWNFSIKRAALVDSGVTPPFEFGNSFDLESDHIRALYIHDNPTPWKIEEDQLVITSTSVNLGYVSDVKNVKRMTDTFKEALAYKLAAQMSWSLHQDKGLKDRLLVDFKDSIREVRSIDSMVGTPNDIGFNDFNDARRNIGRTSGDRSYYWY